MGLITSVPFLTFTQTGFPTELIGELELRTGRRVVGNRAASGTGILEELGEHQTETGDLIVYTSGDSVLQICGNEETMGLSELYRCCEIARELTLRKEWRVGRVIARPYVGRRKGEFVPAFKAGMEALLGEGMCHVVSIRPVGGVHLTEND